VYSFKFHGSLVRGGKLVISTRHTDMEHPVTAQRGGTYFEHDSVVSTPTYGVWGSVVVKALRY
jgi:hypothetical protein